MEVIPQSPRPLCHPCGPNMLTVHISPQTLDREPCLVCQALSARLNSRSLVGFQLVQVPPREELQVVLLNHFPKQFNVKTQQLCGFVAIGTH